MTEATLSEITKLIKKLKFPVDRDSFIKKLQEQVKAISQHNSGSQITPQIEELILLGLIAKLSPSSIVLPNKQLGKKFFFIKDRGLRTQLEDDYYSMELQEQLHNLYEVARFAHLQIENIVNCALERQDLINKIKSLPDQYTILIRTKISTHPEQVSPSLYLLGKKENWDKLNAPSDSGLNFIRKLVIFFAFCVNYEIDGYKNGIVNPVLYQEIVAIKTLRDNVSHRFSLSKSEVKCKLLQIASDEAFRSIKSTLKLFESSIPKWL